MLLAQDEPVRHGVGLGAASRGVDPSTESTQHFSELVRHFELAGDVRSVAAWGSGHINDTYRVELTSGTYLFQRLNTAVFTNPGALMENVQRVTAHVVRKAEQSPERVELEAIAPVPTRANPRAFHREPDGQVWRVFPFLENTRSYDRAENPEVAYQAGRAFGAFLALLGDLPPPRLHETIPAFHHTPRRFRALREAIDKDPFGRSSEVRLELEFALAREGGAGRLVDLCARGR